MRTYLIMYLKYKKVYIYSNSYLHIKDYWMNFKIETLKIEIDILITLDRSSRRCIVFTRSDVLVTLMVLLAKED